MCMSIKRIEERVSTKKNEVLEKKLHELSQAENIDNYKLNMVCDSYGFGMIYAISGLVLGFVKLQERWCEATKTMRQPKMVQA